MTEAFFLAIVLSVVALFIYAVLKTVHTRGRPDGGRFGVVIVVLVFWLAVPAVLASRGVLDR